MLGNVYMFWFLIIPSFFNLIGRDKDVNRNCLELSRHSRSFLD